MRMKMLNLFSQILEAKNADDLMELSGDPTELGLLDSAGFVGQQLSLRNAQVAVQQIIMHEVINKRRDEMADIASGMETLSLQKLLSSCPDLIHVVFPASQTLFIDPSLLKALLKIDPNVYSGFLERENALKWFKSYIDECAQGILNSTKYFRYKFIVLAKA